MLETPMTMKDLGLRMGCDPSFVTSVADALEKHGLARREPSLRDRRSENIVLTPEGVTLRDRLWTELSSRALRLRSSLQFLSVSDMLAVERGDRYDQHQ